MISFKEIINSDSYLQALDFPSVSLSNGTHSLFLQFDSKDNLLRASYTGKKNIWLSGICSIIEGKNLSQIQKIGWKELESSFSEDQIFWDLKGEKEEEFFFHELELLKGALDVFKGREYHYEKSSALICRCFGIREDDILKYLNKAEATLDGLVKETNASMGCRSCLSQLKRFFVKEETKRFRHHYKERAIADWLVQIDYQLARFKLAKEWGMELRGMKGALVTISYDADVSQLLEEKVSQELQIFLAGAVDNGLAFFLRSARHFSNTKG